MDRPIRQETCNTHIREAISLAQRLTLLADQGEMVSRDDSCSVLYGVIRDCAYKIRQRAEVERDQHQRLGLWHAEQDQVRTTS